MWLFMREFILTYCDYLFMVITTYQPRGWKFNQQPLGDVSFPSATGSTPLVSPSNREARVSGSRRRWDRLARAAWQWKVGLMR